MPLWPLICQYSGRINHEFYETLGGADRPESICFSQGFLAKNSSFPKLSFMVSNCTATHFSRPFEGSAMLVFASRTSLIVCCSAMLVATLGGCTVGSKSFSMDSNSRIPFFGLELRERTKKDDGPRFNSISRSSLDYSRVETAVQSSTPGSNGLVRTGHASNLAVVASSDTSPQSAMVPVQQPPAKNVISTAIPLADEPVKMTDRLASIQSTDFQ
jgi:hypothetical protein